MTPAENNSHHADAAAQNEAGSTTDRPVETVYTTVESQHDRTDWLTVVSNLRQVNRQLVEEIARLEQALASTKQSLHTKKEENQAHEITILQQQDDLRIAHDRIGALFQQLETSHQIGQRQQTLIETLSQQLEITKTIVPQIEAEHEELCQKYQQQSQKLTKTEQVAIELYRRLKLHANTIDRSHPDSTANLHPSVETLHAEIISDTSTLTVRSAPPAAISHEDLDPPTPESALETVDPESNISTAEIDPAPPQHADTDIPNWNSSAPTPPAKTILSPPKLSTAASWREAVASHNRYNYTLEAFPTPTKSVPAAIETESTPPLADPIPTSDPNWPAPTLNPTRSIAKTVPIDLPKFPKKKEI